MLTTRDVWPNARAKNGNCSCRPCCLKKKVAESELLPHGDVTEESSLPPNGVIKIEEAFDMVGRLQKAAKKEVPTAVRRRYGGILQHRDQ